MSRLEHVVAVEEGLLGRRLEPHLVLRVLRDVVEAGDVQAELLRLRELAERRAEADQLLPRHPRRQLRLRSRRSGGCATTPRSRAVLMARAQGVHGWGASLLFADVVHSVSM